MLTGTVIHLAHRQHHLRRNVHKIWGKARCKHDICAAWAFTRRANGITQDGAKVAGWTFLKGQKERRLKSGDRVFTEDLHLACSFSHAYVAAFAVVRLVSLLTRALSTGTGTVLKQGKGKVPSFVYVRPGVWDAVCTSEQATSVFWFYLTDGADATQRARAECRFIFAWKHFTSGLIWIQNRNLDSALN